MSSLSSLNSTSSTRRYSFDNAPAGAEASAPTPASQTTPRTAPSQPFQDLFSADGFDSGMTGSSGQDLTKMLQDVAQVVDQLSRVLESMQVPELGDPPANTHQPQQIQGTQPPPRSQGTQQTKGTQAVDGVAKTDEGYGVKEAVADLDKLAEPHKLGAENRGAGDVQRAEIDKNKTAIAEAAINAARRYFPEMSVKDGTRLILSDASLESTFNPKLNAESGQVDPDKTVGLLQARGESNLADFKKHASGEGLKRADGSPWDPKKTETNDLAKIWENIHVGAWYMSTTARLGATSPNEHFDMGRQGPRQTDVTTGLLSHFMGPGGAAENKPGQNEGAGRYLRIVGGELDLLDPNSSQRILSSVLDPQRVM